MKGLTVAGLLIGGVIISGGVIYGSSRLVSSTVGGVQPISAKGSVYLATANAVVGTLVAVALGAAGAGLRQIEGPQ